MEICLLQNINLNLFSVNFSNNFIAYYLFDYLMAIQVKKKKLLV